MSQIDAFLPVEISRTPPYQLAANLRHENGVWSLREMKAKVGETDLAGRVDIDRHQPRTLVTADLSSQSANYKDMRALIGVAREGGPPAEAAKQTRGQRAAAVRKTEAGTGDLTRLRLVDAKIKLKAQGSALGVTGLGFGTAAVSAELRNMTTGACFGASYPTPFRRDDPDRFDDKS